MAKKHSKRQPLRPELRLRAVLSTRRLPLSTRLLSPLCAHPHCRRRPQVFVNVVTSPRIASVDLETASTLPVKVGDWRLVPVDGHDAAVVDIAVHPTVAERAQTDLGFCTSLLALLADIVSKTRGVPCRQLVALSATAHHGLVYAGPDQEVYMAQLLPSPPGMLPPRVGNTASSATVTAATAAAIPTDCDSGELTRLVMPGAAPAPPGTRLIAQVLDTPTMSTRVDDDTVTIVVSLPDCDSVGECEVDIAEDSSGVSISVPGKYAQVELEFPVPVDGDQGRATFSKTTRELTIRCPRVRN
jgi:hypothetical protein